MEPITTSPMRGAGRRCLVARKSVQSGGTTPFVLGRSSAFIVKRGSCIAFGDFDGSNPRPMVEAVA